MNGEIHAVELQRKRWRRERKALRLVDPEAADFATGGLGRHAPDLRVRFVVLPGDPDLEVVTLDAAFWEWWSPTRKNPFDDQATDWGERVVPTATGAMHGKASIEPLGWRSYLALHRHGGIEFALADLRSVGRDGTVVFPLITIVGRVWAVLDFYREAIQRFGIGGPWELVLALRKTAGTQLGYLGEGWIEPWDAMGELPPCHEPGLLYRRELVVWPDADGARSIALHIGAWLDNAWGSRDQRAFARVGACIGQFDVSRFR